MTLQEAASVGGLSHFAIPQWKANLDTRCRVHYRFLTLLSREQHATFESGQHPDDREIWPPMPQPGLPVFQLS